MAFSHWRIERGDGTIDQVNDATTIFTMGIEEARIVAAFEELEPLMTVRLRYRQYLARRRVQITRKSFLQNMISITSHHSIFTSMSSQQPI